jgi:hypothetical protein
MPTSTGTGRKVADFLFVQQDEKIVSKRGGSRIGTAARSHIMSEYLRKKNAAKLQKLKNFSAVDIFMGRKPHASKAQEVRDGTSATAKAPLPRTLEKQKTALTVDVLDNELANRFENGGMPIGRVFEVEDSGDLSDQARITPTEQAKKVESLSLQVIARRRSRSPSTILSGASDPFGAAAAPLGAWEHHLVKFFVECLTPDVYGADKESRDSLMARKAHQMQFHNIIQDAGSLFSLYAVSCANEEVRRTVRPKLESNVDKALAKSSSYYRMKVIQIVRRTIEEIRDPTRDIDDRLIGILLGLLGADWATHDYPAAYVHIKAICNLVKMRGGIHTLNARWAEDVVISDVSMAVANTCAPILPLTWTPVDLPESSRLAMVPENGSTLSVIGQRLLEPQCSAFLNNDLIEPIQKLRVLTWVTEYDQHPKDEEMRNRQWVSTATPAAEHRLLSFYQYHSQLSDQPLQQSIAITLLLFTRSSLHYIHYRGEVYLMPLLSKLGSVLLWTDLQTLWSPFSDILLWVLCMGLFAADKGGVKGQVIWFSRQISRVASFLFLKEWGEVELLLQEFFYLSRIHGKPLKKLWTFQIQPSLLTRSGEPSISAREQG